MWHEGIIAIPATGAKYKYWAKVYDEGSEYGIDEGRISKLTVRKLDGTKDLYNYDRGLDVDCANDEVRTVLNILLTKYAEEADAQ
jgi:hypothetical protein